MDTKERVFEFAETLASYSDKITLVTSEEDGTAEECKEAATFLKVNGKRLGRDLELYCFMSELSSDKNMLCDLLGEILLPIGKIPLALAYREGSVVLRNWGNEVFDEEQAKEWKSLF